MHKGLKDIGQTYGILKDVKCLRFSFMRYTQQTYVVIINKCDEPPRETCGPRRTLSITMD